MSKSFNMENSNLLPISFIRNRGEKPTYIDSAMTSFAMAFVEVKLLSGFSSILPSASDEFSSVHHSILFH